MDLETQEHESEQLELRLVTFRSFFMGCIVLVMSAVLSDNFVPIASLFPMTMSAALGWIVTNAYQKKCPVHSFWRRHPGMLLCMDISIALSLSACLTMVWIFQWHSVMGKWVLLPKVFATVPLVINILTHVSLACELSCRLRDRSATSASQCSCADRALICDDNIDGIVLSYADIPPPEYEDAPRYEDLPDLREGGTLEAASPSSTLLDQQDED